MAKQHVFAAAALLGALAMTPVAPIAHAQAAPPAVASVALQSGPLQGAEDLLTIRIGDEVLVEHYQPPHPPPAGGPSTIP